MTEQKRHYGIFTTVCMIVGIVIGSGIFFKSDNILVSTGGNVALGVLVFCIAAFAIVFGCLTLSSLAALTDKPGGVVTYCEEFIGKKTASAFGWFQTFIYYPTLTVVISWVVGIYTCLLFGLDMTLNMQVLIGFIWFVICYTFNILSARAGGAFQNVSVIIKLIPLILIGALGLLLGDPVKALTTPASVSGLDKAMPALGWLTAIGPIAFSFDGWVVSTAIGFEIHDSKKNLPRALIFAPLFILVFYLMYFIGVSAFVGADQVLAMGDESVNLAATNLFGPFAAKALMVFVVISVMGTVNGVVLGGIRMPYSLALKDMLPMKKFLTKTNSDGMPANSGFFMIALCLVWWVIHYVTTKYELLYNSDISEIAIAMSYLLYLLLYYKVFDLWRKGTIKGVARGVIFPLMAALGSLFILSGALQSKMFLLYVAICLVALAAGYIYKAVRKA